MTACRSTPECPSEALPCNIPVFTMNCETGFIDIALDDCEAKTDCQIVSQVIIALFVKGRDESYDGPCRGGWWGGEIGSRLWTLEGQKINNQNQDDVVRQSEQYIEEALRPLVAEGIIDSVSVNASYNGTTITIDDINISQPDGPSNYSYLWEAGFA